MRSGGREKDALRPVRITRDWIKHAKGSVLIEMGDTRLICTAMVDEKVPGWLAGAEKGWVTAEYGMLPASTPTRKNSRGKPDGRSQEIKRLIGRSLRAVTDLTRLGQRTVYIDCDVLQADGGTRTAAITGACIALHDTFRRLVEGGFIESSPAIDTVAAISVGIVDGKVLLDLDYPEDSSADVDMNVVMTGSGKFVEVQGTAEGRPFDHDALNEMLATAKKGIDELTKMQRKQLGI